MFHFMYDFLYITYQTSGGVDGAGYFFYTNDCVLRYTQRIRLYNVNLDT